MIGSVAAGILAAAIVSLPPLIQGKAPSVSSPVLLLGVACHALGARINTTRSIPIGLYWTSGAPVEKGAYVLFCPPPHFNEGVFEVA